MRSTTSRRLGMLLSAMLIPVFFFARGNAQTFSTIHSFVGSDGAAPEELVLDSMGNLYGVTSADKGTVFELSPVTGGSWSLTTLYAFQGGGDGYQPRSSPVIGRDGDLFGTTSGGGIDWCPRGCGAVWQLSPMTGGGWSKTDAYKFQRESDGFDPVEGLVLDANGNLYGTTSEGGGTCGYRYDDSCGTVYELSPAAEGGWVKTILHEFVSLNDGITPQSGVAIDANGNLYGTTSFGGREGYGVVYELSPSIGGGWNYEILHDFTGGDDGAYSYSTPAFDNAGNLYVTTLQGGSYNLGVVFELSPSESGGWDGHSIHQFSGPDGASLFAGVAADPAGNLYGTTQFGGTHRCPGGCGVVYKLAPTASGQWQYSLLHAFTDEGDGEFPNAVILDPAGNVFGTTLRGAGGTVFEITP